jgi:hypothetical protein
MISSIVSRVSAAVLLVGGVTPPSLGSPTTNHIEAH